MSPLTIRPDRLERLRRICLALPQAVEKEAWGDPTWRVAGHIFAMQKGNYSGGRPSVWLKAPPGEQPAMVEARPDRYFVPPYVGSRGWIGVWLDGPVDWRELGEIVSTSFLLLAPRRVAAARRRASAPRRRGRARPGKGVRPFHFPLSATR